MDPPDRAASTNVAADGEIAVVVGRGREKNDDEIDLGLVVTPALDAEDVEKLLARSRARARGALPGGQLEDHRGSRIAASAPG